jgi:hypothetical protein
MARNGDFRQSYDGRCNSLAILEYTSNDNGLTNYRLGMWFLLIAWVIFSTGRFLGRLRAHGRGSLVY